MNEQQVKLARIRTYCETYGYTGMLLGRQDNFNWITSGGNSRVIVPKDEGAGAVVITPDRVYLVAQVMDGVRMMDEEMAQLDAEYIPLRWYEESVAECALKLAGANPVSDIPAHGAQHCLRDIYTLHFPLMPSELERLETVGAASDEVLTQIAGTIKPDMIDYDVEAMLLYEYGKRNLQCDVVLVGTDERIFRYRHPTPVGAKMGRYVLLHTAARLGGLHANVTRCVYFGDRLPERINHAYQAVCNIEAYCLSQCIPGTCWSDILEGQKRLLQEYGFAEDWRGHYPGGRTGYFVCQADLSLGSNNRILADEAYDWFITVTGAKVEELAVNHNGIIRLLSQTGCWPVRRYETESACFALPQIMLRG